MNDRYIIEKARDKERMQFALTLIGESIECIPERMSGRLTVGASRLPIAQILAEITDGRTIGEVCDDLDLNDKYENNVKKFINALAIIFDYRCKYKEKFIGAMSLLCEALQTENSIYEKSRDS